MAHAAGVTHGKLMRLQLPAEIERRLNVGKSVIVLREYLGGGGAKVKMDSSFKLAQKNGAVACP